VTTFSQAVKDKRAPGATLVLEPWVFADEWSGKPSDDVCVGLRLLSDGDKTKARKTAEELADSVHPDRGANWVECFNDCVQRQVDALGICDPNDVRKSHELLPYAEDQVMEALSSKGSRFIFERIERYEIAASPLGVMADREVLDRLVKVLPHVEPELVAPGLRRLISYVLEELELVADDSVDASAVDDAGNEVSPFIVG
jgi:hypothetical protein